MLDVYWRNVREMALEGIRIKEFDYASSSVILRRGTYHYTIMFDGWRVTSVRLELVNKHALILQSPAEGEWLDADGEQLPELAGAIDIDISITPFTNSLPINRLDWERGQERTLTMVYIDAEDFTFKPVEQTYTYLRDEGENRVFSYETESYQTEITVNELGLVVSYPGEFELDSPIKR
ncbi:putative glycolipid-binding domain-containing protein [Paenalkalicoccus suaedae]|nr:putative glycolipid-binding domain-containing protein [Paenalkalicoccus suaedae]